MWAERVIALGVVVALGTLSLGISRRTVESSDPFPPIDLTQVALDTVGSSTAATSMVIVSDFQCAYCGTFARTTWPELVKEYVDTGRLFVAFVALSSREDQLATRAQTASECGRQLGMFWSVHDALFAKGMSGLRMAESSLKSFVKSIPGNEPAFIECMARDHSAVIEGRASRVQHLNVVATPTFLVGGRVMGQQFQPSFRLTGAQPFSAFQEAMQATIRPSLVSWRLLLVASTIGGLLLFWLFRRGGSNGGDRRVPA